MTPFESERESRPSESTRGKWRNQSLALDSGTPAERPCLIGLAGDNVPRHLFLFAYADGRTPTLARKLPIQNRTRIRRSKIDNEKTCFLRYFGTGELARAGHNPIRKSKPHHQRRL